MKRNLKADKFLHGGDYNPEQWLGTPQIINHDFALFKNAKINTVTVGIFSWAKLEPTEGKYDFTWLDRIFDRIEDMNGYVILATPSGARPAWLAQKYPEVLRTDANGIKQGFGGRHNHCLTSPIYRQKVREINTKLAEHFGHRSSLILWHISNEYSGECYCELCQQAFRKWLKNKYQTLDNLNHAWWNTFWSHRFNDWDQITAPSPRTELGNKGMNLDWRRFITDQTISFIDNEVAPLREITPNIPVTTNMMASEDGPFDGFDYQKVAQHLDMISWDSYPAWGNDYESTEKLGMKIALIHDFFRSLKHQNFMIMENTPSRVNWMPVDRPKRPGQHELASMQDIAHGSESVLYFQLRASRGSAEMFHGAVIEHRHPEKSRAFHDVTTVGQDLEKIQAVYSTHCKPAQVAIVFSYDNNWALKDAESYMKDKKLWSTIVSHYQYFYQHDIPVDFVSPTDDFSKYKLIIDPMHFMMSQKYLDKLHHYVKNGGHLVGTYISGVVDENDLAYMGEWPKQLQEIYGIEPLETDVLYPSQRNTIDYQGRLFKVFDFCERLENHGARVLGNYDRDFYRNTPAITENSLGKGKGYYIACRNGFDFLSTFYGQIAKQLDLLPDLPLRKNSSKIAVGQREDDQYRYFFVQNYSKVKPTFELKKPLFEMFSGKNEEGSIQMSPYQTKVYREEK